MKQVKKKKDDPRLALKLEIAEELGLHDIIEKEGWGALTAAETGRIGGLVAARSRDG